MSSRLPRQVKLFGAVSLLNDFASEMIYPLLPAFLTGVLGAGPQALGALAGWYLLASGTANVEAVIGWSLVPRVAVLVLAVWAVRGGKGGRGGNGRQGAAPSATVSPAPPAAFAAPAALVAISAFYLLRMPDTLIILRSQQIG